MNTLEEMQRQQISDLLKRVATLEDTNKSLFNRCFATTHGAICGWCMIAKECTAKDFFKLEINKTNGGKIK